jgi:hypothetical protein
MTEVKRFSNPIRVYDKVELGLMYFPKSTPQQARAHLREWIRGNKELCNELIKLGYRARSKEYTPRQVEAIFTVFGEP